MHADKELHDICHVDSFQIRKVLLSLLTEDGIDLSRGDPCDPPSWQSNAVIALLSNYSACVLHFLAESSLLSSELPHSSLEVIWQSVIEKASDEIAAYAELVLEAIQKSITQQGSTDEEAHILALQWLFLDNNGGGYGALHGQPELRAALIKPLIQRMQSPPGPRLPTLYARNVTMMNGANEAIGSIFRLLQDVRYLQPGDLVGMLEPAYSPYLEIMRNRLGLTVIPLVTSADNGWIPTSDDFAQFAREIHLSNKPLKLFCLVNPNNPSSRALDLGTVETLSQYLRDMRCLVIEDVVYHEFVPDGEFHNLWRHLPEQTILIHSLSKYHRVTGSRLGFMIVTDAADSYFGQRLLDTQNQVTIPYEPSNLIKSFHHLANEENSLIALAKGAGPLGTLSHTTHMPRPMQIHALVRLLIDSQTGETFTADLWKRWITLHNLLKVQLPTEQDIAGIFVPYYALLDLRKLVAARGQADPRFVLLLQAMENASILPYSVFAELTKAGVLVMPAATFFSDPDAHKWVFRISVANQPLHRIIEAAHRIETFLADLAQTQTESAKKYAESYEESVD